MNNRLTEEEQAVLDKAQQWFRYCTPENHKHLKKAVGNWRRAENAKAEAHHG